jgi:hypothetical protein
LRFLIWIFHSIIEWINDIKSILFGSEALEVADYGLLLMADDNESSNKRTREDDSDEEERPSKVRKSEEESNITSSENANSSNDVEGLGQSNQEAEESNEEAATPKPENNDDDATPKAEPNNDDATPRPEPNNDDDDYDSDDYWDPEDVNAIRDDNSYQETIDNLHDHLDTVNAALQGNHLALDEIKARYPAFFDEGSRTVSDEESLQQVRQTILEDLRAEEAALDSFSEPESDAATAIRDDRDSDQEDVDSPDESSKRAREDDSDEEERPSKLRKSDDNSNNKPGPDGPSAAGPSSGENPSGGTESGSSNRVKEVVSSIIIGLGTIINSIEDIFNNIL